jgi:acyl-CoA thioester hydrolase
MPAQAVCCAGHTIAPSFGDETFRAAQVLSSFTGYNFNMQMFRYFHPITVRYADLDPQGHVNNAVYLSYLEQARAGYLRELSLWDGRDFLDIGIILAETQITYRAPILLYQPIRVGVRVTRLGNKSLDMQYVIEDTESGRTLAQASTILVTYDYRRNLTISVPESWRQTIQAFEEMEN